MPEKLRDLALFVLRLSGGLLVIKHGWGKLVRLASGEADGLVRSVGELGFPSPALFAWAAGLAETAGVLIVLGLLTRACAALAAFTMLVAAFGRHHALQQGLAGLGLMSVPAETLKEWGNPELALVYALVFIAIALLGPGRWSLDALIFRRRGR